MITARIACWTSTGAVAAAALGFASLAIGDRWQATAWLLYVPAFWIGCVSIVAAAASGSIKPPWPRAHRRVLAVLGTVVLAWDACLLTGFGGADGGLPRPGDVVVLHWNVQWGGGLPDSMDRWRIMVEAIMAERPDVVLLSESPSDGHVKVLLDRLGPDWTSRGVVNTAGATDWYKLVVLSNRPIERARPVPLEGGHGVEATTGSLRLLLVDEPSDPRRWRIPFLDSVASAIDRAEGSGRGYDVVAGDFNCPARSFGFGTVTRAGAGFALASRRRLGWRATWPSFLPIYDVDHVLVTRRRAIRRVRMIDARVGDHRGQAVVVAADSTDQNELTRTRRSPAVRAFTSFASRQEW